MRWRLAVLALLALALWLVVAGPGVPAPAPGAPKEPPPGPEQQRQALAEADRMGGIVHRVRAAVRQGRLGAARAALSEAPARAPTTAMRAAELRDELRLAEAEVLSGLVSALVEGRIAQAREALRRLRDPSHPEVEKALAERVAAQGWPGLPASDGSPDPGVEAPAPLPRDRLLRLCRGERWVRGTLVASTAKGLDEDLTVSVREAGGPVFVFAPRSAVEPVDVRAGEALDQAALALRCGDRPLAWMWLLQARGLTEAEDGRARHLRARLGGR